MNPKDKIYVAVHEFENVVKAERLPCLVIIGFPHDQSFIRFSGGMESEQTRGLIKATALRYIGERAAAVGAPAFDGGDLIILERISQQSEKGWSAKHDDERHVRGDLAEAAATYAIPPELREALVAVGKSSNLPLWKALWPWGHQWWKPKPNDRIRELVKAGALIAAEIDRLQRAKAREGSQ